MPAFSASITSGFTPAPTTTASQSISRPLSVTTRSTRSSPSNTPSASPPMNSMPLASIKSWK